MQIYVSKEGQQYGPYAVELLRTYVQQEYFTTNDYACCDGENWVTIGQVPGFSVEYQDLETQPRVQQATAQQVTQQQTAVVQQEQPEVEQPQPGATVAVDAPPKKKRIFLWSSIGVVATLLVGGLLTWQLGGDGDAVEAPDLNDPETLGKILEKAIDFNQVEAQQTPYTGWAKKMHDNGQVEQLSRYTDGKQDGSSVNWYSNGRKFMESRFTDGKQDGPWIFWHENGQKKGEGQYKDDGPDGLSTHWYSNGKKMGERSHQGGKLLSATVWKPNGEKCPVTNVQDGNGVLVTYYENGTEWFRVIYENGVKARD